MKITLKNPRFSCRKPDGHRDCKHADQGMTQELAGLSLEASLQSCGHYRCDRDTLLKAIELRNGLNSPLYKYWEDFLPTDQPIHFPQEEIE
ncbi:MAG: hypothetical protein A2534_04210 [Candidatus Magasanikbacteria bacterium RIFOXYD2_FULL_39_9]|uniref:Uncharacterized protein n=1 Tax=Candidatus Magasanikbacteria bacterium RIFOXYD1_FULL_40_23 TaxID=1798705 RepID=A0A1F6PBR5_9BACT|nr:MAG: hypothetical protein A2534_04210 [Candidatus Magasanikbacteria bacterium RIFOXYD2_FULL_39_9]OGH93394.1 MAG: hypothetical protein A2563_02180 [Candidatus Magasanikbacteria bacterium RIFOXYD1_FULL_40_23]